jgi:integrase
MGTLQERPNGHWTGRVRKAGYPAQSETFPSKKEAERWITDTEAKMNRARFSVLDGEPTLKEVIGKYLLEVTPGKKGSDEETWRLKAMQRDRMAQFAVGKLTPATIANYRDRRSSGMDSKPVSGSTINRELNLLHHVLEIARKEWGIGTEKNPVSDVRRPKNNPARDRRLTEEEKVVLLEACRKTRAKYLAPTVELAIETGMRQGEIVSLLVRQVDLKDCVVSLKAGATKSDEARTVPLSTRAVAILKEAIGERKEGRVWPGLTGEALKQAFSRVKKKIGLVGDFNLTFHDSRHEATSSFIELGLSDTEVMSITGHKTQAMMRRYTHLRAKDLAKKLG